MKVKEHKRKRAEAARRKYKQDKLKREQQTYEDPPPKRFKRLASDRSVGDVKDPHKHINDSLFFHVAEKISTTTPCVTVN